ncbi:IQ-domain 4 [Hirschfeldia incana]|nr:IQ-domain 4 [Hirschfeldia incana]
MGKGWLACVSAPCLPTGKDKKHQKQEKEKKKWFGKQKSRESIEFSLEETTPPVNPLSSSITRPSPPLLPDFVPQPLLLPPSPPPPPPLFADLVPQPLLPPSPPPPPPFRFPPYANNKGYDASKEEKTRKALALASAVAAEAAVVAAQAAVEVTRLTTNTSTRHIVESKDEAAAIKIQNAYRCYKAKHTLRMLRGMVRLKTLLQGKYVKRQMNAMLSSMQTLTRLQTQIQARRNRLSEENKARHTLIQQKGHQKERQNKNLIIAGDFDSSNKSKAQIKAQFVNRKEASVRRERALAYAYSHQQTWRNSTKHPHQTLMDADTPHWGWSWLDRWMASRPWEPKSNDDQASLKRENSIRTSPARSKEPKSGSQKANQSEGVNRRHSIGGGSSKNVKDAESLDSSLSRRSSFGTTESEKSKANVETASNMTNPLPLKKSNSSVQTAINLSSPQPLKISKASVGTAKNMVNTEAMKLKDSGTRYLVNTQALNSKVSVGQPSNLGSQKKVVSDKNKLPPIVFPKKRRSSSISLASTKKVSDSDKATTGAANGEKKRRNGSTG